MCAQSYRDLVVWSTAMRLAREIYRLTQSFPSHELYGLTSQLRRAAVLIPSNIAEGNRRLYRGDYIRHVSVARGSLAELETTIELAADVGYVSERDLRAVAELAEHVGRMLTRLAASLARIPRATTPHFRLPTP